MEHVTSVDAAPDAGEWALPFAARPSSRKPCTALAARSTVPETFSASPRWVGSGLLDFVAALLVRMERRTCLRSARYGYALASRRVQAVLEMAVAQTSRCRKEADKSGTARAHISHGGRE